MQVWVIEKDHIPVRDESWRDGRVVVFPCDDAGTLAMKHWLNLLPKEHPPTEEDGHYYDAVLYKRIEPKQNGSI